MVPFKGGMTMSGDETGLVAQVKLVCVVISVTHEGRVSTIHCQPTHLMYPLADFTEFHLSFSS